VAVADMPCQSGREGVRCGNGPCCCLVCARLHSTRRQCLDILETAACRYRVPPGFSVEPGEPERRQRPAITFGGPDNTMAVDGLGWLPFA